MRSKLFLISGLILLSIMSCQKKKINPDGINIDKAIKSGTLFSTPWIINDDDSKKQIETENSNYFSGKTKPFLTFDKKGTYTLSFDSPTGKSSENGSWSVNSSSNQLILASNGKESIFVINKLDEEDLILTNIYTAVKSVTSSEGIVSQQEQTVKEMLYMEDND